MLPRAVVFDCLTAEFLPVPSQNPFRSQLGYDTVGANSIRVHLPHPLDNIPLCIVFHIKTFPVRVPSFDTMMPAPLLYQLSMPAVLCKVLRLGLAAVSNHSLSASP
jgi:hypothetical protein